MEATIEAPATKTNELASVRAYLHSLVEEAENVAMLEAIATILATSLPAILEEDKAVRLEDIPEAAREGVEEGLRQLDAGQGIPHEQVWAKVEAKYGIKYPR